MRICLSFWSTLRFHRRTSHCLFRLRFFILPFHFAKINFCSTQWICRFISYIRLSLSIAAGVADPVNTWAGWKAAGYMVEHGAKALFQAVLIYSSKGNGQTYRASFFGASQVKPLPTA